jgi:Heterokaryon incompatibility protein (HET)
MHDLKAIFPQEPRKTALSFDLWAKRWFWKPLSGSDFPDMHTDGYFGLSYVWGDASAQKEIEVDGKIVQVGQNLYEALRALREIPEIQMGTRVWIDALCINQQDIEERDVEVKRMADIYTRSLRVISWLGEEKDYSDDGVDFLHFLSLKDDIFLKRLGDSWLKNPDMVSGNPGAPISRSLSGSIGRASGSYKKSSSLAQAAS